MAILGLDHIAITARDPQETIGWYERVLGGELLYRDLWEARRLPVALVRIGTAMVSIHDAAAPASPHAAAPTPGSADVCFRCDGPVDDLVAMFGGAGVEIVEGPVPRPSGSGVMGTSVYVRDPDGNLVEFLTTG